MNIICISYKSQYGVTPVRVTATTICVLKGTVSGG